MRCGLRCRRIDALPSFRFIEWGARGDADEGVAQRLRRCRTVAVAERCDAMRGMNGKVHCSVAAAAGHEKMACGTSNAGQLASVHAAALDVAQRRGRRRAVAESLGAAIEEAEWTTRWTCLVAAAVADEKAGCGSRSAGKPAAVHAAAVVVAYARYLNSKLWCIYLHVHVLIHLVYFISEPNLAICITTVRKCLIYKTVPVLDELRRPVRSGIEWSTKYI